jgi:Flp pilus assembly protein TadD
VLAIEPNNVNALNNKGIALDKLGRHEEAIAYLNRALAIAPNNVNAPNYNGNVLARLQESDQQPVV